MYVRVYVWTGQEDGCMYVCVYGQGKEMAVAATMGELHLLHKNEDGFLYLTFADSWRPDVGRGEDTSDALTQDELDRMLEVLGLGFRVQGLGFSSGFGVQVSCVDVCLCICGFRV
jgi:hypothetical protein